MYFVQLELAAVAVEMSVAQMLKLHLSYVKVSVAVAAGADHIFLPCSECCCGAWQPRFLMSESLSPLIPPPLTPGSCRRLYMLLSPAFERGMMTAFSSSM